MAIVTNTFTRYSAVGMREDLSNVIWNVSPQDTPFVSNIGKRKITNTTFSWQQDQLANAAANAQIDGDDVSSYTAVVATTLRTNFSQIMRKTFIIADNLEVINEAGRKSEHAYQLVKAGRELKRDIEYNLCGVNNSKVSGGTSTARETGSLSSWVATNVSHGSGGSSPGDGTQCTDGTPRAITETILKAVLQSTWNSGGDPQMVMVGAHVKTVISGFSGIAANRYLAPSEGPTVIVGAADVYVSDFGSVSIVPNRFSRSRDAYVLDPELAAVATLRPIQEVKLAKTGDAEKSMLLFEGGLEVRNEKGLGAAYDLSTS